MYTVPAAITLNYMWITAVLILAVQSVKNHCMVTDFLMNIVLLHNAHGLFHFHSGVQE